MIKSAGRPTDDEIVNTVEEYSDMLFKLCFTILCNKTDAEDAVSDTIFKYITKSPVFNDAEHKKAWLIKIATNICKDKHRFRIRHPFVSLDSISEFCTEETNRDIMECMLNLPDKYKTVIHLFYIEGYKTDEIADILDISATAVRKRLQYGRKLLKLEYEKEEEYEKRRFIRSNG